MRRVGGVERKKEEQSKASHLLNRNGLLRSVEDESRDLLLITTLVSSTERQRRFSHSVYFPLPHLELDQIKNLVLTWVNKG
jgi:hypothetical protein